MIIITRKITMTRWSRKYINRIESELRRQINNPDNTRIRFNVDGNIGDVRMKVLAFIQIKLTMVAYIPNNEKWDDVAHWSFECPFSDGVERYSETKDTRKD